MIQFPGYEKTIRAVYESAQEQVFEFWDDCSDSEKKILLDSLVSVDFSELAEMVRKVREPSFRTLDFMPAEYIALPNDTQGIEERKSAKVVGEGYIRKGKMAAFVVAGGQGSRLGFEGPKGAYCMSPVRDKPLFRQHAEKLIKYSLKYGCDIPLFVMTSDINHEETVSFFKKNGSFGLGPENVFFFSQNMVPSVDSGGKIVLSEKCSILKNPDGHGGSLTALRASGALEEMKKRHIETIAYFQVDNPAVAIFDPVFIGLHIGANAEVSSKAIMKAHPGEKVGSFVRFTDGHDGIVEYSDLSEQKQNERKSDGSLAYGAGSIAVHLFDRAFVERITSGGNLSLPIHAASKKIKKYTSQGFVELDGYKFEKFVFDALPLAERTLVMETLREQEFAPVKNLSGADSAESSKKILSDLYRAWCLARSISVPFSVEIIEISPLVAVSPEDLDSSLVIPDQKSVYIGRD